MKKTNLLIVFGATLMLLTPVLAQDNTLNAMKTGTIDPMLSATPAPKAAAPKKVTAVYGITADDYLPSVKQLARQQLRPNVNEGSSRPDFDLPDMFYFVGAPVFLFLFIRVLVIFLNLFEEMRRDEQRRAASEVHELERI